MLEQAYCFSLWVHFWKLLGGAVMGHLCMLGNRQQVHFKGACQDKKQGVEVGDMRKSAHLFMMLSAEYSQWPTNISPLYHLHMVDEYIYI